MRITLGSLLGTVAALAAAAVIAGPASAAPDRHALFVQTDEPGANAVVAYDRLADGGLRFAGRYATGGRGGVLGGSVVDHLASQDSLAYDGTRRLLYAVNAGSDTITTFAVHGDRLVRRQVIASGGSFPVSVAVHGRLVTCSTRATAAPSRASSAPGNGSSASPRGTAHWASTRTARRSSRTPRGRSRSRPTGRGCW